MNTSTLVSKEFRIKGKLRTKGGPVIVIKDINDKIEFVAKVGLQIPFEYDKKEFLEKYEEVK